ncbi:MAG: N-acetylglucosamine-6-phosphate deacetylase [Verrucomicrobiota bacterium]
MKTRIINAHIVSPDVEIENGTLVIENGRIREVVSGREVPEADETIDAGGRYVMPGFFDIHCHGADRKDVCDNSVESLRHIAKTKLKEGVTTWLPTTLTQPQEKLEEIAGKCAEYMANQEFCRTPGLHVEGPFINVKNAGAQNPQFVRPPNFDELRRIHEIASALIVSIAPDVEGANEVIAKAAELGIRSSAAHTSATAAQVRDSIAAGLTHLTHFCNQMTPVHHREIGCVGMGLTDERLMLEVICDKIHLAPEMLKLGFQLVGIDRLMMITDSMAASWMTAGEVSLGGLPVIVKDGKAVLKEGGALAGSALKFNDGVKNIVEITGLPLHQIVKATSWNQAQSLGLDGFGKIEPGFHADLAILDKDFSVWKTLVGGEVR